MRTEKKCGFTWGGHPSQVGRRWGFAWILHAFAELAAPGLLELVAQGGREMYDESGAEILGKRDSKQHETRGRALTSVLSLRFERAGDLDHDPSPRRLSGGGRHRRHQGVAVKSLVTRRRLLPLEEHPMRPNECMVSDAEANLSRVMGWAGTAREGYGVLLTDTSRHSDTWRVRDFQRTVPRVTIPQPTGPSRLGYGGEPWKSSPNLKKFEAILKTNQPSYPLCRFFHNQVNTA